MYLLCRLQSEIQVWIQTIKLPASPDEQLSGIIIGQFPKASEWVLKLPIDARPFDRLHQQALKDNTPETMDFIWRDVKSYSVCRSSEDIANKVPHDKQHPPEIEVKHPKLPEPEETKPKPKSIFGF